MNYLALLLIVWATILLGAALYVFVRAGELTAASQKNKVKNTSAQTTK